MKHFLSGVILTLLGTSYAFSEPVTLWQTGDQTVSGNGEVTTQYGVALVLAPEVFTNITAGARLTIELEVTGWAELYLKNGGGTQIYPSTQISNNVATEVLTDFQLNEIGQSGFSISASKELAIKKIIADNGAYTGDFKNAIWIGKQTFTADWSGNVKFCAAQAAQVKEGDILKVLYTKDADNTSIMVNYIDGSGKQVDYYPKWSFDSDGASFVVPQDFVSFLTEYGKGFVVKGASITVSQIDLIHPATPEDGVLWEGKQAIDWTSESAVKIPAYLFADVKAGDTIVFEYTTVNGANYYNLKPFIPGSSGQIALSGNVDIKANSTSYQYILPSDKIEDLKAYGMEIQGHGLEINKVSIPGVNTGMGIIEIDNSDEPVEYYDLNGFKVSKPTNGLYIKRQGSKITKVIIK